MFDLNFDRMMDWRGMKGAAATRPAQDDIWYIPLASAEATWATAEGLSEQWLHCAEYIFDFISDRMVNWRGMNGAAATAPSHIYIQYMPLASAEATWATAEGLKWAAHCAEYFVDFISDRMRNWGGINGASATTPSHIDIQYMPLASAEATWATAEGLSELLTVLNICLI
jgi:uncharacterized protein (DUF2164 family)